MRIIKIIYFIILGGSLMLSGCAKDSLVPGNYDAAEVGKVKKVISGTIISARPVYINSRTAEVSSNANQTNDVIDTNQVRNQGFEYVIRLNNGSVISVVQTDKNKLKSKQRVLVIYGDNTRVVADEGGDDN